MAAAPSGLPDPAPPRAGGWGRAGLFPEARAGAVAYPSLRPQNRRKNKSFSPSALVPFFSPSSGFRLPDVSGHPRWRRASGGPGPAPGRSAELAVCSSRRPARRPAGSGLRESRGGVGAEPRWRPARPLPAPLGAAPATLGADRGRPGSHLARRLGGAAPAAARCPRRLPASERGAARPGEAGAPVRERAGAPRAPSQPPAARLSAASSAQSQRGALGREGEGGGKARWRGCEGRCQRERFADPGGYPHPGLFSALN